MGRQWPAMGSGALTTTVQAQVPEGGHHYPYHGLVSSQTTGRKHSHTHHCAYTQPAAAYLPGLCSILVYELIQIIRLRQEVWLQDKLYTLTVLDFYE